MKNKNPLVSICCITYNQEQYIRQTLEGFVMQKTNFPVEVVISDDCSQDKTRAIIAEYKTKYPDLFRDVSPEKNMGSMENFFYSQEQAKGRYIAMCEGDDYWIDPLKLQKQVDFLETHPDFAIVFHEVKVWEEETQKFINNIITREVPKITTQQELSEGNFMHTPSVMFRVHKEIYPIVHSYGHFLPDDYVCWMLIAEYGKIYRMPDVMAVYRVGSGIWSTSKTIKNDLRYLSTISKLFVSMSDDTVKENLYKQITEMISSLCYVEENLNAIRYSKAYRLGKLLLKPFRWLKKIGRK